MVRNSFTAEDAEAPRFAEDRIPQRTSAAPRPLRESAVHSWRAGAVVMSAITLLFVAPHLSAQMPAPGEQRTSRSGVYTTQQAERGRMTYALSCRSCHTAASHTGVNPEQYAEVVAYLLRMNAMPAGTTELLADSSALAQIRIELPPSESPTSTPTRKPQTKSPARKKGP